MGVFEIIKRGFKITKFTLKGVPFKLHGRVSHQALEATSQSLGPSAKLWSFIFIVGETDSHPVDSQINHSFLKTFSLYFLWTMKLLGSLLRCYISPFIGKRPFKVLTSKKRIQIISKFKENKGTTFAQLLFILFYFFLKRPTSTLPLLWSLQMTIKTFKVFLLGKPLAQNNSSLI